MIRTLQRPFKICAFARVCFNPPLERRNPPSRRWSGGTSKGFVFRIPPTFPHNNEHPMPPPSPPPSAPALAAVCDALRRNNGWLPFDRYLDIVLHDPACGYYGAGTVRFGPGGDFATAPSLSPLFAECVAAQVADVLRETGGGVLELGAGDGRFAAELSAALARNDAPHSYDILETSAALRERQKKNLLRESSPDSPASPALFRWRETLPETFSGVVFANETLDAIPFRMFFRKDGRWLERGIALCESALVFADREVGDNNNDGDNGDNDEAIARLNETDLPDGSVAEVNLRAEALVRTLARALAKGMLLIADYGHGRAALYSPDRTDGTLMCYRAGMSDANPLERPGAKDITAHLDFTALADAGMSGGCALSGFATQSRFLMNCGALEWLESRSGLSSLEYAKLTSGAHKLLAPQEMGDIAKFIAWKKNVTVPFRGFAQGDIRHKL